MAESTLIVGDVHGCGRELDEIVSLFCDTHNFVLVGDVFDRGLEGVRVWEIIKEHNIPVVLGNHEKKMYDFLSGRRNWVPKHYNYFFDNFSAKYNINELKNFIYNMPLIYQIDKNNIVVHAGVNVFNPLIEDVSANVYGSLGINANKDCDWQSVYDGDIVVYYGHIVYDFVRKDKNSIGNINSYGLDTGACHGKVLSSIDCVTKSIFCAYPTEDYYLKYKRQTHE